ncbi:hypothetical protein VTK26DRAFT_6090 [Humicola hyalothermophila]
MKMWSQLASLLAAPALLAATARAAPAFEVPDALAPRQDGCPTYTRPEAYDYSTVWLSTTTVTYGWSSLGSVTSTKTTTESRYYTSWVTEYSPAVTTLPATTVTEYVASVTTSVPYITLTATVTSPGYAPSSVCQTTTFTSIIPGTTSVTVTHPVTYATEWTSEVGHVETVTSTWTTEVTSTRTTPGSTAYATTVTRSLTYTTGVIYLPTVTRTVWEQGCREWACQTAGL